MTSAIENSLGVASMQNAPARRSRSSTMSRSREKSVATTASVQRIEVARPCERARVDRRILDRDEQHEVAAREPGDVLDHQLGGHGVEKIGEQHDQRASLQARRQVGERQREVGLDAAVVDLGRQRLQALKRVHAALRLGPGADLLVEAEQADAIAGAQAKPAEQQRRVDRVIELGHAGDRLGHQLARVDGEHDLMVALGAELLTQ